MFTLSCMLLFFILTFFFFFNDTATTEIYTLSLHDALPILVAGTNYLYVLESKNTALSPDYSPFSYAIVLRPHALGRLEDRKSTRLNSSHGYISYAVFCLKKKKKKKQI